MWLSGSILVRVSLRARIMSPSLPQTPTARAPALLISAGNVFVDGAGEHHFHDLDHGGVGHPQPVDEGRLDRQPLQHRVDLRPAAMHHDGIDADLFQQGDVAAEFQCQVLLAHGMAAVFHHHRSAGVATQKRQRLGQDTGALGGGGELGRRCGAHTGS